MRSIFSLLAIDTDFFDFHKKSFDPYALPTSPTAVSQQRLIIQLPGKPGFEFADPGLADQNFSLSLDSEVDGQSVVEP